MLAQIQSWLKELLFPYQPHEYTPLAHEQWRLRVLIWLVIFKLFHFMGGTWDIQWHVYIGRDSNFIPPHQVAMISFILGLVLAFAAIWYETRLEQAGVPVEGVVKVGRMTAAPAFWWVIGSFIFALLAGGFDMLWHQVYGLDSTLWSPPHLLIMAGMFALDASLMVGVVISAERLQLPFNWRQPHYWAFLLAAAYTFDSIHFQTSEAFVYGYRFNGEGLLGVLFPILTGIAFTLPLLLSIRLSRQLWGPVPIFLVTMALQYIGTAFSAVGFALVQPESVIEEFVRQNPQSTITLVREFAQANTLAGTIGIQQAMVIWLSFPSVLLVALLHFWPWARRNLLIASPVYTISLMAVCYLWSQGLPVMAAYGTTWVHVAQGIAIALPVGLLLGWFGLWIGDLAFKPATNMWARLIGLLGA